MKNTKILEMINNGEIEELKARLQDEIYNDTLNSITGTKQRYAAMKRYQSSINEYDNELFKRVGTNIDIKGENYNCFIDGVCLALTTENIGELEKHDNNKHGEYFKVERMIPDLYISHGKVNYKEILAEAKQLGYKFSKVAKNNKITVKISNEHLNVALLEKAYSIIDDGEEAEIFIPNDNGKNPVIFKTSIGICLVLPVIINSNNNLDLIIFETEIKK